MKRHIDRTRFLGLILSLCLMGAVSAAPVGEKAPEFETKDSAGKSVKLSDFAGKFVVLEWFNHQCPYVKAQYDAGKMQALQTKWADEDVVWLSICSSAPGTQGHNSPQAAEALAAEKKAKPSHLLLDESGNIGRAYGAKTTPHMFVISPEQVVLYNGAIDDQGDTNYLDQALTEATAGKAVSVSTTRPYGCGVKYK